MIGVKTFPAPPLCRQEILRYAGCNNANPQTEALLEECLGELRDQLNYRVCFCEVDPASLPASNNLQRNLQGCRKILLFAATIGVSLDRLLARYGVTSPARALMLQSIGAERIEALCDAFGAWAAQEYGLSLRPRFSPGYGDLPLTFQRDIFALLEPAKHIGVSLTDSLLMTPSKSVTAFLGLSPEPAETATHKCRLCTMKHCQFRSIP